MAFGKMSIFLGFGVRLANPSAGGVSMDAGACSSFDDDGVETSEAELLEEDDFEKEPGVSLVGSNFDALFGGAVVGGEGLRLRLAPLDRSVATTKSPSKLFGLRCRPRLLSDRTLNALTLISLSLFFSLRLLSLDLLISKNS